MVHWLWLLFLATVNANLLQYLQESKFLFKQALQDPSREVLIVIGNPAGDMDSLVSSMSLAYLLASSYNSSNLPSTSQTRENFDTKSQDKPVLILPVMSIPRNQVTWLRDVIWAFNYNGLNFGDLVFLDQFDINKFLADRPFPKTKIFLTDHNTPDPPVEGHEEDVVGIVDHHVDSKINYPNIQEKLIEVVGSCSTLVAYTIMRNKPHLLDDQHLATALVITILLDTYNLNPSFKVVQKKDIEVVSYISQKFPKLDLEFLYTTTITQRFNVTGFSTTELLERDYKQFKVVTKSVGEKAFGISAIPDTIPNFLNNDRTGLIQHFDEFISKTNVSLLFCQMMSLVNKGTEVVRQLIVYEQRPFIGKKVVKGLLSEGSEILQLTQFSDEETQRIVQGNPGLQIWFFDQQNNTSGRKQLGPLIEQIFKEL